MVDEVDVSFGARMGSFLSGLTSAKDGVKDFSDKSKQHLEGVVSQFSKIQEVMLGVAAIVAGGALFKEMVSSTVEATGEVTKLQKSFGLTLEEANLTRSSLNLLGISTDDYASMAQRLDRQLRTGNDALAKMGLTAKDLDLGQKGVMDKAIAKLAEYKEGIDRNIAAQVLFGRGGAEAIKLVRLNLEGVTAEAKRLEEQLGLTVTPQDQANARQYKLVVQELSMAFEGIKKVIGDAVLPYLTAFGKWFVEVTPAIITAMKTNMSGMILGAFNLAEGFVNFVHSVITGIQNLTGGGGIPALLKTLSAELEITVMQFRAAGKEIGAFFDFMNAPTISGIGQAWQNWNKIVEENERALAKLKSEVASGSFADRFGFDSAKVDEFRSKALKTIADIRAAVMSGKPFEGLDLGSPGKGTKSAAGLLDEGASKDAISAAMRSIDGQIRVLQAGLAQKKIIFDAEVSAFKLTQDQKFGLLQQATQREYEEERALLQKELAIDGLKLAQRQAIINKLKELETRHSTEMIQLDQQSITARTKIFETYTNALESSFNGTIRGMLADTTSFMQATKTILADMIVFGIQQFVKMGIQWGVTQLGMTTATQTGALARATSEQAASLAGSATNYAEAAASILRSSVTTFAGVFANLSPFIGPAAAVPAAASQATVAASVAELVPPLATGAWDIDRTMLAQLHPKELVAPAAVAPYVRDFLSGNTPGSQNGGDTINIQALDAGSIKKLLMREGGGIVKSLKRQVRQGALS